MARQIQINMNKSDGISLLKSTQISTQFRSKCTYSCGHKFWYPFSTLGVPILLSFEKLNPILDRKKGKKKEESLKCKFWEKKKINIRFTAGSGSAGGSSSF